MVDVLCMGLVNYDINIPMSGYPAENSKSSVSILYEEGGGPASNAAYLLSRWGVGCAFAGLVGNDIYGKHIADEFNAVNTDISLLDVSEDYPTSLSVVLVNEMTGSRTIINRRKRGSHMRLNIAAMKKMNPKVILLDGYEPEASLEAMKMFPGAKTILDAGSLRPGMEEFAGSVDYLAASENFALQYTGVPGIGNAEDMEKCIRELYRLNGRQVVVTLGERGLIYGDGDKLSMMPAYPASAVDTTGAGDIFHGAFAYGILKNMTLPQTLKLASIASALSVEVPGGRRSVPSLQRVKEKMKNL